MKLTTLFLLLLMLNTPAWGYDWEAENQRLQQQLELDQLRWDQEQMEMQQQQLRETQRRIQEQLDDRNNDPYKAYER